MELEFEAGPTRFRIATDADGIQAEARTAMLTKRVRCAWVEILAAGVSPVRAVSLTRPIAEAGDDPAKLDRVLPLAGRWIPAGEALVASIDNLAISHRPVGRGRRFEVIAIPKSGDPRDELIGELQARLGDRWIAEELSLSELRKRLGYRTWWILPATVGAMILGFVAVLGWGWLQSLLPN